MVLREGQDGEDFTREIAAKNQEIVLLKGRISGLEDSVKESELKASKLRKQLSAVEVKFEQTLRKLTQQSVRARYAAVQKPQSAVSTPEFKALKSQAQKYLRDIAKNRSVRAQSYQRYMQKKNRPVSFSLRPLRGPQGESVGELQSSVTKAKKIKELQSVVVSLRAVARHLNDDISLLKRLG